MNRRQFLRGLLGVSTVTTVYHDPIAVGAAANAATFNAPLGDLDEAINGLVAADEAIRDEIDSLIIGSGTSDAETIAARGGYSILGNRLEDAYLSGDVLLVDSTFNGSSGEKRYTTIGAALAVCTGGETILIAPGIYTGNVTIADNGIKLIGSGAPSYDSVSGRLVNGTIIRGKIDRGSTVGIVVRSLGVDLVGVNSTDCLSSTTIGTPTYCTFENLALLGNGAGALAHGIYGAGSYNTYNNIRIYNCYHGIAIHGSYANLSNIYCYSCNNNAIIFKSKSTIDVLHCNATNIVMEGNPASTPLRSGPIHIQSEDGRVTSYINISNVTAKYCANGAVLMDRSGGTGTISDITFTNITSDSNLSVADFWFLSGNNIILSNCRTTNRVAGIGFYCDPSDNLGDVYLYSAYADATGGGASAGAFKFVEINGSPAAVTATGRVSAAGGFYTQRVTLANNTAYDFAFTGQGMLMCSTVSGAFATTVYLLASFRASATPALTSMSAGSGVTVGTTALTGTTGTAGKMNVACTNGHIYIENQLGSSISFALLLMA